MSEQVELFPVGDYTDRLYFNDTSTRTKRPGLLITRTTIRQTEGAYPGKRSAQTSTNQVNQGT